SFSMYLRTESAFAKASTREAINAQIISGVKRYALEAQKGETSFEKTVILCDELGEAVDYAYKSDGSTPESEKWAHSVIGVFDESRSHVVCEGYADTLALMLNYLEIPNVYIVGLAGTSGPMGGHAWNAVSFDGGTTYSYIDLTWDDTWGCFYYFGMPKALFENSHRQYLPSGTGFEWLYPLPARITDDMNGTYYARAGFLFDSSTDLDALIARAEAQVGSYGRNFSIMSGDHDAMAQAYFKLNLKSYLPLTYGESLYYCLRKDLRQTRYEKPVSAFSIGTTNASPELDEETCVVTLSGVSPAGSDDYIFLSSSNPAVAVVEDVHVPAGGEGRAAIRLKSVGTTTITAVSTEGGIKRTMDLSVAKGKIHVTGVMLDRSAITMNKGSNRTLTPTILPGDADDKKVVWESSNPAVATVGTSGTITALSAGVTTITVRTVDRDRTATCEVTVLPTHVTGITLDQNTMTLTAGESAKLTATIVPEDADEKAVTWSILDPAVASVDDDGLVTALAKGSTTITAKTVDGQKTAVCNLTVEPRKYTVTVVVKKDNVLWTQAGAPTVTLQDGDTMCENGSSLPNGSYPVFADGQDTGRVITVADEAVTYELTYYTISFLTGPGGNVLQSDVLPAGSMPAYRGDVEALKFQDDEYKYHFADWNPSLGEAQQATEYYATYTMTPIPYYTVTFVNDGQVLSQSLLREGSVPVYEGIVPVRSNTAQYCYTWDGWDQSLLPVSENITYHASYQQQDTVICLESEGGQPRYFTDISSAIETGASGTITILRDCGETETVSMQQGQSLTIDASTFSLPCEIDNTADGTGLVIVGDAEGQITVMQTSGGSIRTDGETAYYATQQALADAFSQLAEEERATVVLYGDIKK
ncbi:MAG: Ig-like domain-containing protein, partial [Lachnospiraceae bacterium]|nr:Ig-like domain-containing protein [Lachnospiraceae bacterium]